MVQVTPMRTLACSP